MRTERQHREAQPEAQVQQDQYSEQQQNMDENDQTDHTSTPPQEPLSGDPQPIAEMDTQALFNYEDDIWGLHPYTQMYWV